MLNDKSSIKYDRRDRLCVTSGSVLWRAVPAGKGGSVLMKCLEPGASSTQVERLRREFELLGSLESPCVPKPRGFIGGVTPAIILEDFLGTPLDVFLKQRKPEWRDCLRLASRIVTALESLHSARLVHRDLRPANILVTLDGADIRLLDLSRTSGPEENSDSRADDEIDWAYVSPEQTGRMNRPVDHRSDFYSLGVILYRMLAGDLPFQASDPLEWAHAHAARLPRPLEEIAPDISPTVARIVTKLLGKDPDERYQSAQGVQFDLDRCRQEMDAHGKPLPFDLGTRDGSGQFHIPRRLYGREGETAALLGAFKETAVTGCPALVLVAGSSGMGKSFLVHGIRKSVEAQGGNFLAGKFDQYKREIPYATIAEAFRALVQKILAGREEDIIQWKRRLGDALGSNGGIISAIIPQLELILGKQSPAPDLPPLAAKNRFHLVFRRFLGAVARPREPLVLFLDDLQWADGGSLSLVEQIILHPETRHVVLIGAYRNGEVTPDHPLSPLVEMVRKQASREQQAAARSGTLLGERSAPENRTLAEIRLNPPDEESLRLLVADTLRCSPSASEPLSELLRRKTGGNPFFVSQFLQSLHRDGLISYDLARGCWTWDMAQLNEAKVTENVVDLMAERIAKLDPQTREALKLAACLGSRFDLDALALIMKKSAPETAATLRPAVDQDLIQISDRTFGEGEDAASKDQYLWLHDKVQQAAYSMIAAKDLPSLHLSMARGLLGEKNAETLGEEVFTIANHYNLGSGLLKWNEEIILSAKLNLTAGRRAKGSSAYASAIHFLECGLRILGRDHWENEYELAFPLHMALAEACFLGGRPDEAIEQAEQLLANARRRREKAAALQMRHNALLTKGDIQGAVDAEMRCLSLYGIELPAEPTQEDVNAECEKVRGLLGSRSIEAIANLPPLADPGNEAPMLITVPSFFKNKYIYMLRVARITAHNLEHGNTDVSVLWYGSYGVVLSAFLDDFENGYRFAKSALALMEKRGALAYKGKAYLLLGWTAVWRRPLDEVISHYQNGLKAATESGDLIVACYCCSRVVVSTLAKGVPLDRFLPESESSLNFVRQAGFRDIRDIIIVFRQFARAMQGKTISLSHFGDEEGFNQELFEAGLSENRLSTLVCWYWIQKLRAHFLAGEYASALACAEHFSPMLWASGGQLPYRDCYLYHSLALAAEYGKASPEEKIRRMALLKEHERQFGRWAAANPPSFGHNHTLVMAEIARIEGRDREAAKLYEESIRRAHAGGFLPDKALAYELAARFHADQGFAAFSELYYREALAAYRHWGAEAKVHLLEKNHPHLRARAHASSSDAHGGNEHGNPGERLDLLAVLKASQAISGQIILNKLLEALMRIVLESAGAQKADLVLIRDESLWPVADASAQSDGVAVNLHPDQSLTNDYLPHSILNYVLRSREKVILADACEANPFSNDEYLQKQAPKSVLCLPILRLSEIVGLLYLENNLIQDAFTPDRLAAMEILASQAAISLENARLFEGRKRTEEALRESQQLLQNIIDNTTAIIFVKSLEGRYLLVNRRYEELHRVSKATFLGRGDYDIFSEERAGANWALDQMALEEMRPLESEDLIEQDGEMRTFLSLRFPLLDEEGKPYAVCGISTDVTRVKQVEEQFRQSQKMEAIGRLAGGVAHDFNNLLTVINGYSMMALESLDAANPMTRFLQGILKSGEKAAGLTQQLLAYSRKQVLEPKVWDLGEIVREMEPMLKRLIGEDIELKILAPTDQGLCKVDRGQFEQIILNLSVNARDAMPRGGSLIVETSRVVLENTFLGTHLEGSHGPHVSLSVTDSGVGMTADTKARIFEPFFTTKEVGKGTGLGLSVVYGIVKQSGGSISVTSETGEGTTFHIYFPEVGSVETTSVEPKPAAPQSFRGGESILLVEDDESVRQFMRHALEAQGYRITAVTRSLEALDIIQHGKQTIDLLLTDVVMPELGGLALAKQVRARNASLPVLFMSGYTEDAMFNEGIAESGGHFLQKPINPFELARKVRQLLD